MDKPAWTKFKHGLRYKQNGMIAFEFKLKVKYYSNAKVFLCLQSIWIAIVGLCENVETQNFLFALYF